MINTTIQYLGHASLKITSPEIKSILVDPWLTSNPMLPPTLKEQQADLILITHGHFDHMDLQALKELAKQQPLIIANPVCKWYLIEHGIEAGSFVDINIGGTVTTSGVQITMVQAHHISYIPVAGKGISYPHEASGFVITLSDGFTLYVAGDTGVFADMRTIGEVYRPQLAILPIGDVYTMGPREAAYAIKLLQVKHVIPYHYGTFPSLTGTPEELKNQCTDIEGLQIHVLSPGEMVSTSLLKL
jgi:L-ascorbate metabolism protein UlaG (beta-lactamase superfamily)